MEFILKVNCCDDIYNFKKNIRGSHITKITLLIFSFCTDNTIIVGA